MFGGKLGYVAVLAWISTLVLPATLFAGEPSTQPDTSGPRIAVLPVEYAGDLDEHWRGELQKRLLDGLVRGEFTLVAPAEVAAGKGFDAKCATVKCYAAIASQADAKYIIRTRVAKEDRDYRVSIEVVDPADGDVVASTTEPCNLCGASEVGEIAGVQAAVLRRKLDELVLGPPMLVLESSPTGAHVLLDGEPIGSTPLRHVLTPGNHVVRVGKDGHGWQERSFGAVAGVEEQLSITLPRLSRQWRPKARKWGWALLSIGGVAIVSGAVLIAIDDRQYQRRCDGADVDPGGNCRFTYDTIAGGIAALVTGVALAATGTGLAVAGRKHGERSSPRAAALRRFGFAPLVLGR